MRVSELANELGKTSKEVLDIIKQKDSSAALFAASSVSKDQENMVRNAVSQKKEGKTEPAKKKLTAVFRPQNAQQQIKNRKVIQKQLSYLRKHRKRIGNRFILHKRIWKNFHRRYRKFFQIIKHSLMWKKEKNMIRILL